jgi:hypothetical protein
VIYLEMSLLKQRISRVSRMVQKYLGIPHEYGIFDCIELIKQFYAQELLINFDLPTYPKSREWMKHFTTHM